MSWPIADNAIAQEDELTIVVQVNGKLRDKLVIPAGQTNDVIQDAALNLPKIIADLQGKVIKKVIVVSGKLVNIVAV